MWIKLFERNLDISKKTINKIKDILLMNRGNVYEIPYDEHVILLFSGGMDSTTLIDIIIKKWNCKVILLYFERNSNNQRWEKEAVLFFYDFYKKRYPDNILELLILKIEIPSRTNKKYLSKDRQKIFGLPLRNNIMWGNAFSQVVYLSGKYNKTIRTVIVGSVEEDINSPESGIFSIISYNLNVCVNLGIWYYQLLAPLIDNSLGKIYNKKDLVTYTTKENIPLEKSRSCFGSNEIPCNTCLACINRINAYQ